MLEVLKAKKNPLREGAGRRDFWFLDRRQPLPPPRAVVVIVVIMVVLIDRLPTDELKPAARAADAVNIEEAGLIICTCLPNRIPLVKPTLPKPDTHPGFSK